MAQFGESALIDKINAPLSPLSYLASHIMMRMFSYISDVVVVVVVIVGCLE